MPISTPSLPSVPDGLHVDGLTLGAPGLLVTARISSPQSRSAGPVQDWLAAIPACAWSAATAQAPTPRRPVRARRRRHRSRTAGISSSTRPTSCAGSSNATRPRSGMRCGRVRLNRRYRPVQPRWRPGRSATGGAAPAARRSRACTAKVVPIKDIARRLNASRNGVRRWVRTGRFVPYHRALMIPVSAIGISPSSRRAGRTASETPPCFTARFARSASLVGMTSFGAGRRGGDRVKRLARPPPGSPPRAASHGG